ncbi:cholinephosphotransferase 1 isoform X2 [Chrysoperla carnea]|uniref:cholinephosphotransferase 1 isoform X2 n=1 Tax=Chrysoperla carnea TaxID=189513 RepID=UPI001D0644C2|nr:cholinephosphotransferase 1 isoform X2 [Chrysoperla carnea]
MQLYKERLLSGVQLKRLADHKYSCNSHSLLDPLLQPWWCWLLSKLPLWLAPNLITIIGLIINIATTLLLVWFSPDARIEPPRWGCALCALGLFIYQSLDAIDGKQARRTGTSSPLGELFDHGCDSLSTIFVAISACISVQLGYHPTWMFFQCFSALTLFYCAHWQAYVSGSLRFGRVDVTEAQFTIIAIQLISAFCGPSIWTTKIAGDINVCHLMPIASTVCGSVALYNMFTVIFTGGVGKNGSTVAVPGLEKYTLSNATCALFYSGYIQSFITFCRAFYRGGCGKNGSTVAGTSVLSPVIPFSLVIVPAFIICRKSVDHVYEQNPVLYILAFGMVAAKVTNRLVVAHMTKSEMEYMDWSMLGPAMLFLNQYFNTFIPEYIVLWLCLAWVTFDLLRYSAQICREICDHLRINLFTIPYGGYTSSSTNDTSGVVDKSSSQEDSHSEHEDCDHLLPKDVHDI